MLCPSGILLGNSQGLLPPQRCQRAQAALPFAFFTLPSIAFTLTISLRGRYIDPSKMRMRKGPYSLRSAAGRVSVGSGWPRAAAACEAGLGRPGGDAGQAPTVIFHLNSARRMQPTSTAAPGPAGHADQTVRQGLVSEHASAAMPCFISLRPFLEALGAASTHASCSCLVPHHTGPTCWVYPIGNERGVEPGGVCLQEEVAAVCGSRAEGSKRARVRHYVGGSARHAGRNRRSSCPAAQDLPCSPAAHLCT